MNTPEGTRRDTSGHGPSGSPPGTHPDAVPTGLPRLARFGHLDPSDGACLMEYVSVLAGEPWSDRPAGTHALLATVARIVNDESSESARRQLGTRAPALAGCRGDDPRTAVSIVEAVLDAVLAVAAPGRRARRLRRVLARTRRRGARLERRAVRRGERWPSPLDRWADRLYQSGPAQRHLAAAVAALTSPASPAYDRDGRLLRLLDAAIRACAAAPPRDGFAGGPEAPQPDRTRRPGRRRARAVGARDGRLDLQQPTPPGRRSS
jgi:hypothetical protein